MDDPFEILERMQVMAAELYDDSEAERIMSAVAPIAATLCAQADVRHAAGSAAHASSWPLCLAFPPVAVASKGKHGPDNPTYKQAVASADRAEWHKAMEAEMNGF